MHPFSFLLDQVKPSSNDNLPSGLECPKLGPQKRHPAPYACKKYEWIFHKYLHKTKGYKNTYFQPKQDTHADFKTYRHLQALKQKNLQKQKKIWDN